MERVNRLERYQVEEKKSFEKRLEESISIRRVMCGKQSYRMEIRE
jgi:hypothetical protein